MDVTGGDSDLDGTVEIGEGGEAMKGVWEAVFCLLVVARLAEGRMM